MSLNSHRSITSHERRTGGSRGVRDPPFVSHVLSKQPSTGGKYDMKIWWKNLKYWHGVTPPLRNPGYAPAVAGFRSTSRLAFRVWGSDSFFDYKTVLAMSTGQSATMLQDRMTDVVNRMTLTEWNSVDEAGVFLNGKVNDFTDEATRQTVVQRTSS